MRVGRTQGYIRINISDLHNASCSYTKAIIPSAARLTAHHGREMYIFTAFRMDQSQRNTALSVEAVKLNDFKKCNFHTGDFFFFFAFF